MVLVKVSRYEKLMCLACTESFCGWGIVSGIAVAFILAHFWLTAVSSPPSLPTQNSDLTGMKTLSEVLNATLASSVFSSESPDSSRIFRATAHN